MSRWVVVSIVAALGWGLMAGSVVAQDEISLPQQMGAINDYAASLGRQTREHLQSQIDRLNDGANVDLAVLVSLIDPFGDSARYAEAIWSEWDMASERAVLLVYVREAENRWVFRARASSDLSDQLSELRLGEARSAIDAALADRDVADAVRIGVDALAEKWAPATPAPADESSGTNDSPSAATTAPSASSVEGGRPWWRALWVWILGGALVVLTLLAVVIWALLTWFCPRCGSRLRKRTESPMAWDRFGRGTKSRSVYYCPRCRYVRRSSRPRRPRRREDDRRRPRGERRRAAGRRR